MLHKLLLSADNHSIKHQCNVDFVIHQVTKQLHFCTASTHHRHSCISNLVPGFCVCQVSAGFVSRMESCSEQIHTFLAAGSTPGCGEIDGREVVRPWLCSICSWARAHHCHHVPDHTSIYHLHCQSTTQVSANCNHNCRTLFAMLM